MYQIGDQLLYGIHGVCHIVGTELRSVDRKKVEYYALEPVQQPGTRFYVPTQNQAALAKLKPVLTAQALTELLESEEAWQDSWIAEEGRRKNHYRDLLNSGDRAALASMLRSLYRHKEEQTMLGRKFHLCDENFMRDAEKFLGSEMTLVLHLEPKQVGEYLRKTR